MISVYINQRGYIMACSICGSKSKTQIVDILRPFDGMLGSHPVCAVCKDGLDANGHFKPLPVRGGKREGAGRPKSESTKMMRVPVGAESLVRDVIHSYKRDPDNVFILDGHEFFMIKTYLSRKKVAWSSGRAVSRLSEPEPIHLVNEFIGDELLICFARKGIIKP